MDETVADSRLTGNSFAGSQFGLRQARYGHKTLTNCEVVSGVPSHENARMIVSVGVMP